MKSGICKLQTNFIRVVMCLIVALLLFGYESIRVSATSWIDKDSDVYEMLYGEEEDSVSGTVQELEEDEPGMIEEFFSGLIIALSKQLNNLLSSQDINLSIDGIVFGRMAASISGSGYVKADFTHFGLEENNPWGIIGATVFYVLRNICLVVLPVVLLVLLIMELFQNTAKGRARLKELAMHTVYVFGLMFILPYALDLFIYFRDVVLYSVYQAMNGLAAGISGNAGSSSLGIVDMMLVTQDGRVLNALVLLASVCAGLFFLVDYIRIALLLTLSFGLFPVVAVMSFWDHKKLSEWSSIFFPNLLVPFIDMLLVLIPTVLNALFVRLFGNGFNTVLVGLIILIVIWNVVMVRNRVVKLLGFDGMGGAGGFGQMLETLAHLRPYHRKGEQEKEKAKDEKAKNGDRNSYTEKSAESENNRIANRDEMSPAIERVVNSDSAGEHPLQKADQRETDEFLAEMEEATESNSGHEKNGESGSVQPIGTESDRSSDNRKEEMPEPEVLSTDTGEPNVVTPGSVEEETAQILYEKEAVTGSKGYSESVSMMKRADMGDYGSVKNKKAKDKDSEKIKSAAGKVAKTSAKIAVGGAMGAVGAFAAGYGGMGTSIGAGIVAAHGGSKLVDEASDALVHAPETIEKGKMHAKEAVLAAYQKDYEIFGVGTEGNNIKSAQDRASKRAKQGAKEANRKRAALELEAKKAYQAVEEMAHQDFID